MRWQQLFADLGAQFDEAEAAAERAESATRVRTEAGAVRLAERMAAAVGQPVVLRCRGAGQDSGVLADTGVNWLLVEEEAGREVLVAGAAVLSVAGLGRQTAVRAEGAVRSRLDLRWAVRALARDRSAVHVVLEDGGVLVGTVDRVGADFLELAVHPADEPRRPGAVRAVVAVPLDVLAVVRTGPGRAGRSAAGGPRRPVLGVAGGRLCRHGAGPRLGVLPLDEALELVDLDAPLPPAADLDGDQLLAPDQRVGLRPRHVEDLRDVVEGQEAGCGHRCVSVRSRPVCQPHRWRAAAVHTRTCG